MYRAEVRHSRQQSCCDLCPSDLIPGKPCHFSVPSFPFWKKILLSCSSSEMWWAWVLYTPKSFFLGTWTRFQGHQRSSELRVICRGHTGHGPMWSLHNSEEESSMFAQRVFRSTLSPELPVPVCITEMYLNWEKDHVTLTEHARKSGTSPLTAHCVKRQLTPGLAHMQASYLPTVYSVSRASILYLYFVNSCSQIVPRVWRSCQSWISAHVKHSKWLANDCICLTCYLP